MLKSKIAQKIQKIATGLGILSLGSLGIFITASLVLKGQVSFANTPENIIATEASNQAIESVSNFQPPDRGAPNRTADGGARGCGQMTLITPGDRGATTISENPTFFWYLNPTPDDPTKYRPIQKLAVVLINEKEEEIYAQMIDAPSETSIVSFKLPDNELPTIEPGKWYNIFIGAYNQENPNIYEPCNSLSAWVKRQVLTPEQQQELSLLTSPEQQWNFYIQHEIWYDALAILEELRLQNPDNPTLNQRWNQMLESIELGELANQPLLKSPQIVRHVEPNSQP